MKCLSCRELFHPDRRNHGRQKYCAKPVCRKVSKARSQARWLSKPANKDYFRDPSHGERVRQWRAQHPGYWKKRKKTRRKSEVALQDSCEAQPVDIKEDACVAVQDQIGRAHV